MKFEYEWEGAFNKIYTRVTQNYHSSFSNFVKKKALHRFMSMRVTRAGRNSMVAPERSPLGNYKLYFF